MCERRVYRITQYLSDIRRVTTLREHPGAGVEFMQAKWRESRLKQIRVRQSDGLPCTEQVALALVPHGF